MNEFLFLEAVGYLDDVLLSEHLREKEERKKKDRRELRFAAAFSAVCASFCVLAVIGTVLFSV